MDAPISDPARTGPAAASAVPRGGGGFASLPGTSPMQRAAGRVRVTVASDGTRTRLRDLHQSGCLKLRLPRVTGAVPEGVLINTSGGLTGGDGLRIEAHVGANGSLALASQTAERLYRSTGGAANVAVSLRADEDARLSWLPQETIAFEGSALRRTLEVELAPSARFLAVESVCLGRLAMGERVERATLRDDWRVRVDGTLVHAEALRLGPEIGAWLARRGAGAPDGTQSAAFATVLSIAPEAPDLVAEARVIAGRGEILAAVDAWKEGTPRLVARLLAPDGFTLRRTLVPLLAHLHARLHGLDCPVDRQEAALPAVWSL